jgi:hypothetical protein
MATGMRDGGQMRELSFGGRPATARLFRDD